MYVTCLRIRILDKGAFKSNHYWLMALVGRMHHLKTIKFHRDAITSFGVDGWRYLQKGITYFKKNGGSLSKLEINGLMKDSVSEDYLLSSLKCFTELKVLKLNKCSISVKEAQIIGKLISDIPSIQELDLQNMQLD